MRNPTYKTTLNLWYTTKMTTSCEELHIQYTVGHGEDISVILSKYNNDKRGYRTNNNKKIIIIMKKIKK